MAKIARIDLVYVDAATTFAQIKAGTVADHEVHRRLVYAWLLNPANDLLASLGGNPFNGMALLGIQLMFFEMHGKFLSGQPAGNNGQNFRRGWDAFSASAPGACEGAGAAQVMWEHGRCGLFHDLNISKHLSIDYGGLLGGKVFGPNPLLEQSLVSPRNMQPLLTKYFDDYVARVRDNPGSDLAVNFRKTYAEMILGPMAYFEAAENWRSL